MNKQSSDAEPEVRLLSKAEVCDRVGATFPTIWAWMRDGKFPRARSLGGRTVWLESEIVTFCLSLPKRQYLGDPQYVPPPGGPKKRAAKREAKRRSQQSEK